MKWVGYPYHYHNHNHDLTWKYIPIPIQYHYDTLNQPSESIYVLLVIQANKHTNKQTNKQKQTNTTDNSTDTATATTTRINATAIPHPHKIDSCILYSSQCIPCHSKFPMSKSSLVIAKKPCHCRLKLIVVFATAIPHPHILIVSYSTHPSTSSALPILLPSSSAHNCNPNSCASSLFMTYIPATSNK